MESKQFSLSIILVLLIITLLSVTPWYVNINKPTISDTSINLKNVSNVINNNLKSKILGHGNIDNYNYFITKITTYSKNKSLIPGIYKDSILIKKRTIYTCK